MYSCLMAAMLGLLMMAAQKLQNKKVLFVGTKPEAKRIVREQAELIDMPFVTERWLGGTLTNAKELRGRVERLIDLQTKHENDELVYQTKKVTTENIFKNIQM